MARERVLEPRELGLLGEALDRQHLAAVGVARRGSSRTLTGSPSTAPCRRRRPGRRTSASRRSGRGGRAGSRAAAPAARPRARPCSPLTRQLESHPSACPRPLQRAEPARTRPPSTRRRTRPGTSPASSCSARPRARSAAASPSVAAIDCSRTARSSVTRRQHGPGHVLADDEHAVVAQQDGPARAERRGDGRALLGVGDQLGRVLEDAPAPSAKSTASCVSSSSGAVGRAERRRVRRMAVDDRADVRPRPVDLGVQHRLEVHVGRSNASGSSRSSATTSSGSTSSSATPLRLIQTVAAPGAAGADVAEREVGVALEREDAAGPGDLLAQRLRRRSPAASVTRRSVGG